MRALPVAARWCAAGGGILLLLITVVTAVNAAAFALDLVARNFGARVPALSGYEDFVRLTVGPALLMMLPHCQLQRGHIAADVFTRRLSSAARRRLDRLWRFATAAVAAFLACFMLWGMLETRNDNALSPILGWREWLFYIPGVGALFLWALAAAGGDDEQ